MPQLTPTHPLFTELDSRSLTELFKLCNHLTYSTGDMIFDQGSRVDGLYFLTSGFLKITRLTIEGEEQLIDISCPGNVVGEMALYDDGVRSAAVKALSDAQITFIKKKAFFEFADNYPMAYRIMLGSLAARLRETNQSMAQNHFLPVAGQVAAALMKLAESIGKQEDDGTILITEKITHNDLGSMVGASRENVSRSVSKLKKNNIVKTQSGFIYLLDTKALAEMCEI